MLAPDLTADDFLFALQSLLPRGRVWSRDGDTVQIKTLEGCAPTFARLNARANYLLTDGFPSTTYELLPEWESSLGLPDPCAGESPTIQQRRAQVVARLASSGGQSLPYFEDFASSLGYDVDVINYVPARAGHAHCGEPDYGEAWAHAWAITLPLSTITFARASQSVAGEPLASWGNAVIQCEMDSVKPAHTVLLFNYLIEIFDNTVVDDFGHPVITSDGLPVIL